VPGNDWTAEEMAVWQQQCLEFLQEGAVKDKRLSKAKKAKTAADVEHVASYDESLSWHNAVLMLTGEGLCQFLHEQLCEKSVPRALYLCMDWCQTQWRVIWFLRNHYGLCVEGFPELVHRRERDLELAPVDAIKLSRYMSTYVLETHVLSQVCQWLCK
jgi:hypothetical protein